MKNLLKNLYNEFTRPIREKWIGTLQAAAVVRSLYLTSTLKKYISKNKKYKILDAGGGVGAPLTIVQARRFSQCDFVSVDLYPNYPLEQHLSLPPNIIFIKKDLFQYSAKNQYDIIICFDVLEHVKNYKRLLILFNEWIKPDGTLLLHTPSLHQIRYLTKNKLLQNSNERQRLGDYHVREGFQLEKILKDIENIDFKILYSRYTFSSLTWFFKELFSIGESKSVPGIGIMIFPFILLSTKIESFLRPRKGNGIFIVAKKLTEKLCN